MITKRLLEHTIENWDNDCPNIMDSQKEYNNQALQLSKARLLKWIEELDCHE